MPEFEYCDFRIEWHCASEKHLIVGEGSKLVAVLESARAWHDLRGETAEVEAIEPLIVQLKREMRWD